MHALHQQKMLYKRFSKDKNKNGESHLVQSKSLVPSLTPENDAE
jgi:hypothetical protein